MDLGVDREELLGNGAASGGAPAGTLPHARGSPSAPFAPSLAHPFLLQLIDSRDKWLQAAMGSSERDLEVGRVEPGRRTPSSALELDKDDASSQKGGVAR